MTDVIERRPIVAYVLDLFDVPPKPVLAWRPSVWGWRFCDARVPLSDAGYRQWAMLRADTVTVIPDGERRA